MTRAPRVISTYLMVVLSFFVHFAVYSESDKTTAFAHYASIQTKKIHNDLVDFTLVTAPTVFPKRDEATKKLKIDKAPEGTIVTLHDLETGAPLESCIAPCKLPVIPKENFFLMRYKPNHRWDLVKTSVSDWKRVRKSSDYWKYDTKYWYFDYPLWPNVDQKMEQCRVKIENSKKINGPAKPCVRVSPIMPAKTVTSGVCTVMFDVDENGLTENWEIKNCTHDIFKQNSLEVLKYWLYFPKKIDGVAVRDNSVESVITYKLDNGKGDPL